MDNEIINDQEANCEDCELVKELDSVENELTNINGRLLKLVNDHEIMEQDGLCIPGAVLINTLTILTTLQKLLEARDVDEIVEFGQSSHEILNNRLMPSCNEKITIQ